MATEDSYVSPWAGQQPESIDVLMAKDTRDMGTEAVRALALRIWANRAIWDNQWVDGLQVDDVLKAEIRERLHETGRLLVDFVEHNVTEGSPSDARAEIIDLDERRIFGKLD